MDVDERIVFHGLGKVDGVQDFYAVARLLEHLPRFQNKGAFRKRFVNTENDNSLKNELFLWCTALEIACCHFLTD